MVRLVDPPPPESANPCLRNNQHNHVVLSNIQERAGTIISGRISMYIQYIPEHVSILPNLTSYDLQLSESKFCLID